MSAKIAIFDCDGTLIDGQASICEAMDAAFSAFNLAAPDRNEVRRAVGLSLPQAVRRLLPDHDAELHLDITDMYKQAFRQARVEGRISQPLIPGITDVLEGLKKAGWQLGVATGMSDAGLTHCLASHGITDMFMTLQTADRHPSKPHPSMIYTALFDAAADAQKAVMIGDTVFDIEMARNANVRGIGVDWGYHPPHELLAMGAEIVARNPAQLLEHLLK